MKNKITKFVSILSIIFISFFINQNKAEAGRQFSSQTACKWYTYQSFIEQQHKTIVNSEKVGSDKRNLTRIYVLGYTIDGNTASWSVKNLLRTDADDSYDFQSSGDDFLQSISSSYNSSTNTYNCPDYVELSMTDNGLASLKNSTSEKFKNYIKNQYNQSTMSLNGNTLSYKSFIFFSDNLKKRSIVFTRKNLGVGDTPHYDELKQNDSDVFQKLGINTNMIGTSNSNGGFSGSRYSSFLSKEFYNSTKAAWESKINGLTFDDTQCSNSTSQCKRNVNTINAFNNWFSFSWQFVLEDSYSKFKKFYKFAQSRTLDNETIEENLTVFDHAQNIENSQNNLETLESNPCSSFCSQGNETSQSQCLSNNPDVISCENAYRYCNSNPICSGMQNTTGYSQCISEGMNSCLQNQMGTDRYNRLQQSYNERRNELNENIENERQAISDYLKNTKAPDLNIDFKPYKVTCDDVAIFHTFYVILEIMAPILVILFGTIDYAKAVMASDVEKMQKAKKNFPKRLGLLLLFIFVPLLVSFLIGEFSSTNSSLMYCIINGG